MTFEQFDKIGQLWPSQLKAQYDCKLYGINCVNFQEHLVCIDDDGGGAGTWVRCENITIVDKDKS